MPTIQAWQHIYSNVEKEQSPHRQGGFQTLFYSKAGLTPAEVEEMESRLLYFPSQVEPVKHLFFSTSSGKGVIAQIVALPDPDQFGRKGRYLAHSLIFSPESLAQFEADPFRVFQHFHFITSVKEALSRGNFQSGDIPPVSLSLPADSAAQLEAARTWSPAELTKLALLALRVDRQTQNREAITLTGQPAEIESALAASFLAAPTILRPRCAFDTYFYRCNLVATYFWAVGLPEPPASARFALVDGGARQVRWEEPGQPETAYERWAVAYISAVRLDQLARQRDRAFALAEWLDGRDYQESLVATAPGEVIEAVLEVNPAAVQARLRREVGVQLPPALVQRAADQLYRQMPGLTLYNYLRQGFTSAQLLDALYNSYAETAFKEPPGDELKALEKVLAETKHPLLPLFLAYWRNPRQRLPQALEDADEAAYRQFAETALTLKLLDPVSLLSRSKADIFLELYLAAGVENMTELVEALLELDVPASLAHLNDQVAKLPAKELKRLADLVEDRPDIPASFQTALKKAIVALPPESGLTDKLQALWRRVSRRED
ncbi:MAG: hypothetical protein L6R45_31705 [Anaerolineae bacterium]|nr:hypothetical protein [Anaerolineae bacterium]